MSTAKAMAAPLFGAVFIAFTMYLIGTLYDNMRTFEYFDANITIYRYTIIPFFLLFLLVSFSVHLTVSAWKSGNEFLHYVRGVSIAHFGLIIPTPIIVFSGTIYIQDIALDNSGIAASLGFAAMAAGFAWGGVRLLRSRFFATVAGPRPWAWVLPTLVMGALSAWSVGVLILMGIFAGK
ncbi:hypothetical protein [Shumkonia mesophila]|uniref:hypothetical protein n=1 Tax=Shumkonia mesophila TaxID=2838854 RepID=UPI002934C15B|nr:hypothetical protein [Shumkonia mesophila]